MAYNPGIQYRGDVHLAQGLQGLGRGLAGGISDLGQQQREQKEKDRQLAEENKRLGKVLEGVGYTPGQVASMGIGEKRGAVEAAALKVAEKRFNEELLLKKQQVGISERGAGVAELNALNNQTAMLNNQAAAISRETREIEMMPYEQDLAAAQAAYYRGEGRGAGGAAGYQPRLVPLTALPGGENLPEQYRDRYMFQSSQGSANIMPEDPAVTMTAAEKEFAALTKAIEEDDAKGIVYWGNKVIPRDPYTQIGPMSKDQILQWMRGDSPDFGTGKMGGATVR